MPNTGDGLLHVGFLDIGQGDCSIIKCPNGQTILIDCGTSRAGEIDIEAKVTHVQEIVFEVADQNQIDVLIMTHSDQDHYNRISQVVSGMPIGRLYFSGNVGDYSNLNFRKWWHGVAPYNNGTAAAIAQCSGVTVNASTPAQQSPLQIVDGTRAPGPACTVSIMASNVVPTDNSEPVNTASMITLISFGTDKILVMGDATTSTEQFLLNRYGTLNLRVGTMRVPHHGSDTSSSQVFVTAAAPQASIISCAVNNGLYLLPKKDVVQRYVAVAEVATAHDIRYYDPVAGDYVQLSIEVNVNETELNGSQIFQFTGA